MTGTMEGAMGGIATSIYVATPPAPGSTASSLGSIVPATRGAVHREPWPLAHAWTNDYGTGSDFRAGYANWVESNVRRFNKWEHLCNWFPINALVGYAAVNGLRVRLRRWPGLNSTESGAVREWNTDIVEVIDSHDGSFASKQSFLLTAMNTVTAHMIGTLNSAPIDREDLHVGDMLLYSYSDRYWHAQMVVRIEGERFIVQQGSTPKQVPAQHEEGFTDFPQSDLYEQRAHRWDYAFFDIPPQEPSP